MQLLNRISISVLSSDVHDDSLPICWIAFFEFLEHSNFDLACVTIFGYGANNLDSHS